MTKLALLIAAVLATPAAAADRVVLSSKVLVEKAVKDANGREKLVLEEPKLVVPGDRLVFALDYRNIGDQPATNFVVTNPLPTAVAFDSAADPTATVSVDGGKSWGRLADLRVRQPDQSLRPAQASDVTHVRWTMASAIPAGAAGRVTFRGTVK